MLNCRQILGELSDYLDEVQAPEDRAGLERHLAACAKCRIVCETTRQTLVLYKRLCGPCVLPADVEARLLAAIGRHFETRV